ncbi:MAG: putative alpha/beta hydrolase [Maribacter sp.]|jgi:predicted alpha/beta hydrolase
MTSTKINISTADNYQLSAVLLRPDGRKPKAVIQFHAGTVLKKEFYLKFCTYLADAGFAVVLFDYRGVGESRSSSLKGFQASISDWGIYDAPAVLDWIKDRYKGIPVHLLAHSMGGQILGLMHNWVLFDKIIVLASSSGNWNNFIPSYKRKVKWSSNLFFPLFLPLYGYVPGKFGLGDDWPRGVAEEWWQNCRQNSLMADFMQQKISNTFYKEIDKSITAWFFPDDRMATPKTRLNYQKSYPNAKVDVYSIQPESCNLDSIGHFGLFKEKSKDTLWAELAFRLEE